MPGIHDRLPDALRNLAEALARCSGESSLGTLNSALKLVARIRRTVDRRLLASHDVLAHIMRESADAGRHG